MSTVPEAFIPLNGSAGNSAPVTGGRRHKLKVVTRKQARKMLKKLGAKMRGGEDDAPGAVVVDDKEAAPSAPAMGGAYHGMGGRKRGGRKGTKKTHRGRKLFGLKY